MQVKKDGSLRTSLEIAEEEGELAPLDVRVHNDVSVEIALLMPQGKYDQLKNLLEFLNANGAYVNYTCGLHVHLDQRHNDRKEALKVYSRLQNALPSLLTKLVGNSRLNVNRETNYAQLNRNIKRKYQAVNFLPYQDRKTIEVRLHQGTLNYAEVTLWIETLLAVSEAKGLVAPKKQKTFAEVLDLLPMRNEVKEMILTTAELRLVEDASQLAEIEE